MEQATKKCPRHQEDPRLQSASAFQGALHLPHRGTSFSSWIPAGVELEAGEGPSCSSFSFHAR